MQQLPAKDQAVFRSIVKFYETKEYKKGIKAADSILKKHPNHGETLCMKGLTLSYLEKKEEAYELVRKGLKFDLKSHVCWHVYGLLWRQDREYLEAVKCYRSALRIDPDNIQILRDLSLLQIHRRDTTGFAETRRKLLQVKPSNRMNWVGYAIAEHLCKNYEFSWTCLDNYENTFKDEDVPNYENSELFMYKATIMEEAGKFEEALDCLNKQEKKIVDKLGFSEMKGRLLMFLKRFAEAGEVFAKLLKQNPEHHTYILASMACKPEFHRFWPPLPAPVPAKPDSEAAAPQAEAAELLPSTLASFPASVHPEGMPIWGWLAPQHALKAHPRRSIGARLHKKRFEAYEPLCPLTDDEEAAVLAWFEELQKEHPRSDSLRRLVFHFMTGDRFTRNLDTYLRSRIRKGIPALFRMMRPLYFQPGKPEIIEQLLMGYCKYLAQDASWFGPSDGSQADGEMPEDCEEEPPSCYLFTLMLTAEHFDFLGNTKRAFHYVDTALEHTPTLVELYACKSKICKHSGDFKESAKWADEVRSMDLADRYLNTQCVRALLRTDDTDQGREKALLFSKDPESPEAANLHDMQCMWYESAVGRSFVRQRKHGKALKIFNETFRHFNDIAEDQFDFHNYCLRKTTLKAYVAMLRMQERLYSHKFYRRAAKDAIRIYVELFDMKARGEKVGAAAAEGDSKEEELSAADQKKLKHKLKREQTKKTKDEAEKKAAAGPGAKPKKADDDPDGEKLLEEDPMEKANKLVKTLLLYCKDDGATHNLAYEVAMRQGKLLHCLQALIRLWELAGYDNLHYKLAANLAHFCYVADLEREDLPDAVRQVILAEMAPVLGARGDAPLDSVTALRAKANSVVDQVEDRLKKNPEMPLVEVMYSLKCLKNAGRDQKSWLESGWQPKGAMAIKECQKLLAYLSGEYGQDSASCQKLKSTCKEPFPTLAAA